MIAQKIHRFFTISDFEQEEEFLREQHQNGLELAAFSGLTCYHFKRCEPKDVVYRLDYCNPKKEDKETYLQMFQDYGWEYLFDRFGWSYFRKEVTEGEDIEIFSDNASRLGLVEKVFKTRMLPILVLFLCCIIPQLINSFARSDMGWVIAWLILFAIYVCLILHCGRGFLRLKKKYDIRK